MKPNKIIIALLLLMAFSCSTVKQEDKPKKQYTIAQFMDIVQLSGGAFSPDDSKILVSTKETGIFNAFEIDLKSGEKKQLTTSTDDAIFARSYFPGDDRVIYTSDKGGNEITHIYVRNNNGSTVDLIQDTTAKAQYYGWSHDRKNLYYLSNSRDKRYFDLLSVRVEGAPKEGNVYPSTMVYQNNEGLDVAAISDDGRYVALTKTITTNNSDMYLLDTQSKKTKHLSAHTGNAQYVPQYFSLDGKTLYCLTDEGSEYMYLSGYDVASGEKKKIEEAPWDLMTAYLSHNGKYRVVAINNDARTEIRIYDESNGGQQVKVDGLPDGDITGVNISDSEKWMSFYVSSSKSPANLFVYNFETKEVKQLTNTMSADIDQNDLVAGEVIRYKSFDGMEIPALLYKPRGLKAGEKVPALLFIHGGPGGQTRLNYSPVIQHLVNHNYVILAVNNRGSSGYGKTFFAADDRKHGDADLKDCVESKKFLATLDYVDMSKVGIMGGSYGGYMVMAALAFAPEEFNVGVNIYGVTNWLRTLKSIPPWWTSFREALYAELGDPAKDSVALYNKSPLFHAKKITKPFIVLQGSNDPRVLQVESDEIVAAAKANGVPVDYIVFPDEGHGFLKKENNIKASKAILKFLDIHLKGLPEDQAGEKPATAANQP
ncbi:S9 family peptidase [Fulvivirgaceae bacterium PWU4]|uniref:S9 family peptidase n=1 Tax=Chryseosolibacter histidini TaxID=2782349 RepID=A0AAP2DIL1_9BACT|nr:S9 family peptidase [Chryseosolibacter histidini]MBT1697001.1 S9 family peptidase [Chryseosolibacter histidini]